MNDEEPLECPKQCGGQSAVVASLSDDQRLFRVRNGCDADSGAVSFDITCTSCNGHGGQCELCAGSGAIELHRCGSYYQTPDINRALTARARLVAYGLPPVSGAWDVQSAQFVEFLSVFDAEEARERAGQAENRRRRAGK